MNITLLSRVKGKRDTHENWTAIDPVLLFGEIITVEMSDGSIRYKTGDGETAYSSLPFASADIPITKIVSTDSTNPVALRSLDSGSYVLQGKFCAYEGHTGILSFSSALMVNIIKATAKSSVQIFYPVNNCVQFLEITDTTFTRTNVYLNQMLTNIGTVSSLTTTDKSSLVAAINELVSTIGDINTVLESI